MRHRQARRLVSTLNSPWKAVTAVPPDPILGLVQQYKDDPNPRAVNLAQGAYRDDEGKPFVLEAVVEAERRIQMSLSAGEINKEYLGIEGHSAFRAATAKLVFGNASCVAEGRVATVQSISGTSALRIAAEFLRIAGVDSIWMTSPSYANHPKIFEGAGFQVGYYTYLDKAGVALDFDGFVNDLCNTIPQGAAVLLHACAHNPTGVDPSQEQWKTLGRVFAERQLLPVFDSAYQGFASGDLDTDAFAIREFERLGVKSLVCTSFAKSMGLYGERIGALSAVCEDEAQAATVLSVLKQRVIRPMYSSPPLHGARLAALLLEDPELNRLWRRDLHTMAQRILKIRADLRSALLRHEAPGSWEHITAQIGMFAYTGLKEHHVARLLDEHGIYLTSNGRMSLAGMKSSDVDTVAKAVSDVLK